MSSDRYVLLERIGVGGMAEVFRASARGAEGFERPIAIKRILPSLASDEDFVRMFVDEAKIAVQLQHPNIVQIFDLGRDGDEYFIAMELVHGKDLRAILDRVSSEGRTVPLAVALHIAMKVCEALHHAHCAVSHGGRSLCVVHRDVTPQNVLVSYDGEVKVTDFGLAKAAGRATQTQAGVVKGKLAYMAPEAFAGLAVDHRSDVFGVGILLWEMLSGRRLFLGASDLETIEKARLAIVPPLRSADPSIPAEVERIVRTALARDREQRYQTAEALHDELEAFTYGHQEFLTTAALASWLREHFAPERPKPPRTSAPVARAPDVATREIRLGDVGRHRSIAGARARSEPPHDTMPPAIADAILEELEDDEVESELAADDDARDTFAPPPPDESFEEPTGPIMAEPVPRFGAELFDDTTGRMAPGQDPFDDTTGRMMPAVADALLTEMRYDHDLVQTIPRPPLVPRIEPPPVHLEPAGNAEQDLAWDEDEEQTVVGPPVRPRDS